MIYQTKSVSLIPTHNRKDTYPSRTSIETQQWMSFAGWDVHFFVSGFVLAHVLEPKWDHFYQTKNSRLEEIKKVTNEADLS